MTWWAIQSRGWWCWSPRLRPRFLLWCSRGRSRGPVQDSCLVYSSSETSIAIFCHLRSVKDCPIVLGIIHRWVVLDLFKSEEKTMIPRLINYQIQLLVLFWSPVPCPLFAGEVGDKVVNGVLDGLLSSTVAQLGSQCICPPRICLFLINFAHLKVSTILWNSRGLSSWGLIL